MADVVYPFYSRLAKVLNSNQSRSVILCGNVHDLFHNGCEYVPLIPFLCGKCNSRGIIRVVYELNGPVRILDEREKLKSAVDRAGSRASIPIRSCSATWGPKGRRKRTAWAASSSNSCWTPSATPTWPWSCSAN